MMYLYDVGEIKITEINTHLLKASSFKNKNKNKNYLFNHVAAD